MNIHEAQLCGEVCLAFCNMEDHPQCSDGILEDPC